MTTASAQRAAHNRTGNSAKRGNGQYFTIGNPFDLEPFEHWARHAGLPMARLLEPFAGANNIVRTLAAMGWCNEYASYDIAPAASSVRRRNCIKNFPKGHRVCVTNPPWLARNSATRRGLPYPQTRHDNLYKHCLQLCLANCRHVAAIIPASYLQARLFLRRLDAYILLHNALFNDTENPACLALFSARADDRVRLYSDNDYMGTLSAMHAALPVARRDRNIRFNDPRGQLGFISFDNTESPGIRFCRGEEVDARQIKVSSRFITRISGDFDNLPRLINRLNDAIARYRHHTKDMLLTPFKGLRKDGRYRRRMDYALARDFINAC